MSCPNINSSEFKQTEALIGKQNTYKLFMLTNDYVLDIQENDSPNTAIQKLKLKYNSNEFGNISDSNYQDLVNEINSYNSDSKKINIDQKEDGTYKLSIVGNTIQKPNSNIQVQKNPLNTVARIENNKPLRLPAEKLGFNQQFKETHSKINFILGKIINQGNCSEEYKFLASFLKGLPNEFKDGDVRAVEGLKRQKGRDGEFGETSHRISVDDSLSEEQMITAFLHEMLHMFTSDVLKNPQTEKQKEIKRAIEVLRQNVKSYYEQQLGFEITEKAIENNLEDLRPYYGLINVDEFISELFTNKSFQRLLSNGAFSESKSFLQRIAELLRELIEDISGFKFSKQNNVVLDSAISNSLRLISDITSVPIGINISENTKGSLSDNIIKEGVKEVFKENSELAKAIYESLGFEKFNFTPIDNYSSSLYSLDKKEEAKLFLQSLKDKKLFSPIEILNKISKTETSELNKGLSNYLISILEKYKSITVPEEENPYRLEFKENLKLSNNNEDNDFGTLGGFNRQGYKAINLTGIENRSLINLILHEFIHDIEPFVLNNDKTIFPTNKGRKKPLTEKQKEIGLKLEDLRKYTIKHLSEDFKQNRVLFLENEIKEYENGKLLFYYGEGKPASPIYIENLKLELKKTKKVIEDNEVEKYIEKSTNIFFYKSHYGLSNLNEFIAESITNEEFRKVLNNIPYKNTTLLSYLFDLFQQIIGIKKDTVLSETLNLIHDLATTDREQLIDSQITPQQKQQAQQLYSNFLSNFVNNNFDTIIQDLQSKNILDKKCS